MPTTASPPRDAAAVPAPRPAAPDVAARDAATPDAAGAGPALSAGCRQLVAAGSAALTRFGGALAGMSDDARQRLEVFRRCVDSPNGGHWVLSLDRLERAVPDAESGGTASGAFSLVHVDAAGQRVAFTPSLAHCGQAERGRESLRIEDSGGSVSGTRFPAFEAFDWDHDGEVEVFLRIEANDEGVDAASTGQRCGRIWTFRNGAISAYAPAGNARLENLADVDHDGRPDVTTYGVYTGGLHYGETPPPINDELGPELVMRALPDGTFSLTDPAAVAATRANCAAIVDAPDYALNLAGVACARMRGQTPAAVQALVREQCGNDGAGGDFCNSMPEIRRWIALPVPVSIAP